MFASHRYNTQQVQEKLVDAIEKISIGAGGQRRTDLLQV